MHIYVKEFYIIFIYLFIYLFKFIYLLDFRHWRSHDIEHLNIKILKIHFGKDCFVGFAVVNLKIGFIKQ